MRILYFHQHFSTPRGATGIRSYEMARRLVAAGHHVTMVCGSYGGGDTGLEGPFQRGRREGMVDGIRVIEFALSYSNRQGFLRRTSLFLSFALRSIGIALRESCDLVFATSTPLTAAIPGIAARWLRGKTFVFEVRDLWPELPREMGVIRNPFLLGALGLLEWMAYHSANRLIGLSPGMVEGIARRNIDPRSIAMIPNGCDVGLFKPGLPGWRPEGIDSGELLAVFSGTHGIANGLDVVVDTAEILQRRGRPDIALVLVGQGGRKSALQQRALDAGLGNLHFLDPLPKHRLAGLLSASDVGLQILANVPAFYYGTSPNKFFDYLAAGLPVLCNYPGWVSELIEEHACGFSVPAEYAEGFADRLEWLADNRDALPAMGENARALALSSFHRDKLGDEFVSWITADDTRFPGRGTFGLNKKG